MRTVLIIAALSWAAAIAPAAAQPAPRGSYQAHCTDIRMNGQFLSAYCRGPRGSGPSSINVESCSTDIYVNATGGLACIGPGGGEPPRIRPAPPGFAVVPPTPEAGPPRWRGGRERGREAAVLYRGRNWRGAAVRVAGPTPDLARVGLNDRVGSIRIEPGARWLLCDDAEFRGRCLTIEASVPDTRRLGMRRALSSLRPLR